MAAIMKSMLLQLVISLLLINSCLGEGETGAVLVGVKSVLNNLIVKGMPIHVQYDIYNIGDKAAINVQLQEDTFPVDYFRISSGLQHARWLRIAPKANVSHSLVLTPLQSFAFNISQAVLRYKPSEDSNTVTTAHTTGSGEISVYDLADYEKQFSAHATEWLTFGMMTTPSVLIPFLLWYKSMRKYTTMGRVNKKYN